MLAYEDLVVEEPRPAAVPRICARRACAVKQVIFIETWYEFLSDDQDQ